MRSRSRSELILTAHHAISDGLSAIMLMDNLLAEYADAEAYVKNEPVQPLPMVTSARTKGLSGWLSRFRLLQRIVRMQREEKRLLITPLPEVPGIPHQSQWAHWVFSGRNRWRLSAVAARSRPHSRPQWLPPFSAAWPIACPIGMPALNSISLSICESSSKGLTDRLQRRIWVASLR